MEVVPSDAMDDMHAGTASDHFKIGMAHLWRSVQLSCGGGNRPASGADVTLDEAALPSVASPSKSGGADRSGGGEGGPSGNRSGMCTGAGGVVLPTESWKESWDLWVLLLILYSALFVPYRICFGDEASGYMFIFEQVVTACFITDVTLNFNTAFLDEDERWVTSRGLIAQQYFKVRAHLARTRHACRARGQPRQIAQCGSWVGGKPWPACAMRGAADVVYGRSHSDMQTCSMLRAHGVPSSACRTPNITSQSLPALRTHLTARLPRVAFVCAHACADAVFCRALQGWFWIDAPSSIPIELIGLLYPGDTSNLASLRFLRLFRLLRLLRLVKVGEAIASLEIRFDLNLTFLRICQLIAAMLFLAHMLGACACGRGRAPARDHDCPRALRTSWMRRARTTYARVCTRADQHAGVMRVWVWGESVGVMRRARNGPCRAHCVEGLLM